MEYNIFISYAWVDNEIFPGADQGWVSTFVDALRKQLAREFGHRDEAERIWLDYEQMRGNDSVSPTIQSRLDASRTLLLVLSNGYLASAWCRQELQTFADRVGAASGRIFVVQMSPVEKQPDLLQDLVKYPFWFLDDSRQPVTRWFPHVDPTDREYSSQQQRLARDIVSRLHSLDDNSQVVQAQPSSAAGMSALSEVKAIADGGVTPTTTAGRKDRFVLVSGGEDDRELICQIARRLEQHNLGVAIPLSLLADQSGIKSSALTKDLRTKLSLCNSVLVVFRNGPIDQVSQHMIECLKAGAKTRKGELPPTIDLCQTRKDHLALGLCPPGMRVHVVDETCTEDCVEQFLEGLNS